MAEAAEKIQWAHQYETIYILRPNTDPDDADKVAQRVAEVVDRLGGKLVKVDNWGKRRLAYPIKKFTRGVFVYVKYAGFNDVVAELERNLRMLDTVVRYQTIVVDRNIDMRAVEVDPEEVKFLRIEVTEDEEEPNLEEQLGLAARERDYGRSDYREQAEEGAGGDESEEQAGERPAPAEAAAEAPAKAAAEAPAKAPATSASDEEE